MTVTQYAPAAQWQPPRQSVLLAELTADGSKIALVAAADAWDEALIAQRLRRITPLAERAFVNGQPTTGMYVPATWAAVVQLGFTFTSLPGVTWAPGPRLTEWIVAEWDRRTSQPPPLTAQFPPGKVLRDYQVQGAELIADEGRFLLLDEPGLGKTIVTLAGIEQRRLNGLDVFPLVVIVPSWEVADVWAREIGGWLPGWPEPAMHKGPGRHEKLRSRPDICITTYATARLDAADAAGPLCRLRPASVACDEAHLLKTSTSRQSLAARRISKHAGTVICASGTLVANMRDAHPALEAIDPRSWPSGDRYVDRYCEKAYDPAGYDGGKVIGLNRMMEPEFRAVLLRQMRRVAKADVLEKLPPKIYSVRRPEIPDEWMRAYRAMEQDMLAQLPDGGEMSVMDTLTLYTRLSQLASSAADVTIEQVLDKVTGLPVLDEVTGEPKTRQVVTLKAPSWKAETLLGILAERPGQGVAVFMDSRQLALITGEEYLKPAGYRYGYVIGKGAGITDKTRSQAVDGFQAGELDVIVCTAGAGGLGITLTRAGTVVMLQRHLEYDKAIQPEDRAQRIGAEKFSDHIEVIDVVAKGTVDQRRREILRDKAGQFAAWAQDVRIVRQLLGGLK